MAAAREGDQDAFAQLFLRYADLVRARVTRLVGPVAERDDLIQQTFLRLHQTLPDYRGDCALPTFLYRITVTVALDHLRSARRRPTEPLPDEALDALLGVSFNETARAQAREDLRRLFRALTALSAKKRIAFLLIAVDGMSLAEAGAVVGASAATVKQRVLAARRELVELLGEDDTSMSDPREQELDRLCGVLACADEGFDDVGRARAEARLRQALSARSRRPSAALAGTAALAVAIAATLVIAHPWRRPKNVPAASAPALVLRPYVVAPSVGGTSAFVQAIADGPSLDVPAGWLVRASLNDGITVGAVGPTRLTVSGTASTPQLHLERGRVLVEVTPGRGNRALAGHDGGLRRHGRRDLCSRSTRRSVNVRHGRVRVDAGGAVR